MSKYTNYQLSEEFRDRHGFNEGDIFFLKEALEVYAEHQAKAIQKQEEDGGQSIVSAAFFEQLADDLLLKAKSFLVKRDVFDDEE
jgi:hypothetical protein